MAMTLTRQQINMRVSLTAKQELDRIGKALALGLRAGGACSISASQTASVFVKA
jgi:hypothetical protein